MEGREEIKFSTDEGRAHSLPPTVPGAGAKLAEDATAPDKMPLELANLAKFAVQYGATRGMLLSRSNYIAGLYSVLSMTLQRFCYVIISINRIRTASRTSGKIAL